MSKILIKSIGAAVSHSSFLTKSLLKYRSHSLRIPYYHLISSASQKRSYYFDSKGISVREFEDHILFFKKYYDFISLEEALKISDTGSSLRNKIVLTFDDGFSELYSYVYPILVNHNIPASVFLISNCIDNKDLMWRNKLLHLTKIAGNSLGKSIQEISEEFNLNNKGNKNLLSWSSKDWPMNLKDEIANRLWEKNSDISLREFLDLEQPYLTSDQIKEMSQNNFHFGTHSMSHPYFSRLSYAEFEQEIDSSIKVIEEIIEKTVAAFSYPFGNVAKVRYEERYLEKRIDKFVFLGTKNALRNSKGNIRWERDNLEFTQEQMAFRFTVLPFMRRLLPIYI